MTQRLSKNAIHANHLIYSGLDEYPSWSAIGWLKINTPKRKSVDNPNRNQNEVLKVFFSFSLSAEKRKNAVSKPKESMIFTKEINAYRFENIAKSLLSI
jgi:hypothetical protein